MICDVSGYMGSKRGTMALEKNGKRVSHAQGAIARQEDARIMLALDWQTTG